ncbi:hypothetical protein [Leucobacter sp. GX24907]
MFAPWRLSYEGVNYEFGTLEHAVQVISWEQAPDSYEADDDLVPGGDLVWFGQDTVEPGEITIQVKIDFTDAPYPHDECVRLAMEARSELLRVWRADRVRAEAGALADLTIGGEYVIEGRPRRAAPDDDLQSSALLYVDLPFKPAHTGAYRAGNGDGWHSATLRLVPAQSGGLMAPLMEPLRTAVESSRASPILVDGDAPVNAVYELQGPIQSGAIIEVPRRWRLYMNRAFGPYDRATVDTRPGRMATYLNDRPAQLLDPRSSLMEECTLLPGDNVVALRGASIEGTAQVDVRWRNRKGAI